MALTTTSTSNWDTAAYDAYIQKPLRTELFYDMFATVKADHQTHNGASVTFNYKTDLAVAVTPLTETADVTPVAMADTNVTVTLLEYGNTVNITAKLRGTAYAAVDKEAAETIGRNAGESLDGLVAAILAAGSNVKYHAAKTARNTLAITDTLTAADLRYAVAKLRGAGAPVFSRSGGNIGSYIGIMHPDVAVDFRQDTGAAAWVFPAQYVNPGGLYNGEVGRYEGVSFIESPRAPLFADASNGAGAGGLIDVYGTLIIGQRALAKAYSKTVSAPLPETVTGPVVDSLRRFQPVGWYWLGGYGRFLENAMYRIETASSIGVNA